MAEIGIRGCIVLHVHHAVCAFTRGAQLVCRGWLGLGELLALPIYLHLHRAECLCISLWQATDGILVTVVLPDSRLRSPATIDIYQQSVDVPTASMAVYRPTTACLTPPNIVLLLDGECGPCPEGAECPGLCNAGLSSAIGRCERPVFVLFRQRATLAEVWVLEWRRVVGLCQALQQS